ncbi:MAG: serine hydrolase domain-containing protein, partial [Cyclobacteriaceae bacterium]
MKKILLYITGAVCTMLLWAVVTFLATVNGWYHQPIANQSTSDAFKEAVESEITKQFTGNFSMAVMSDGKIEYEKFYSVGSPVNRNTVFQVASLSKWVSAFGIMKLVEDGQLDLDAPVSKYLTRWQLPPSEFNNEAVTVRRLLSHTAGLTDELGYSGFEKGTPVQPIEQSLTQAVDADEGVSGAVRVGIEPGSEFKYSGGGYTLLQLIAEEVSGQTFADYMKENIFQPLQMIHSTYTWPDSTNSFELVEFYNSNGTKAPHYQYTSLAATSLYTSLSDLEIFFQVFLAGSNNEPIGRNVLKPETIKLMRSPHAQTMGEDIWGLGTMLFAATENGDFIIGHDGKSTPSINTAVRLNPETGDGIIVLETGNPLLATKLASEWVFWKTGKVDTLLFTMETSRMITIIGIGWAVIVLLFISLFISKR